MAPIIVVAGALIGPDGRIAMHRRPEGKHHGGLWEFPGGKVDPGEQPDHALARELQEELAIVVAPDDCVPSGFVSSRRGGPGGGGIVLLLYACRRWSGTPDPQEGGALRWTAANMLDTLDLAPLDRELLRFRGFLGG
ncbi:(deoxy)nucleoside triphosphate pyrophosphohydrolase [uncultured Croceicoccus sp.]|uniref:(deoxy)nucleoside triphosphate pyrophosphohydrolase n=1 Tax=uncultured Croceicoccus sp. TaxID=1295329 RepID=UPI002635DB28|nr:(deoxy)nucleoside triphosphate pyrophosphohydrolase [uncultured Croceicoccus sp.]